MKFSLLSSAGVLVWGLFGATTALPATSNSDALSARADVTGQNIVYAEADNRAFVGKDGQWEEHIEGQLPFVWTETSRSDTVVYMERGDGFFKLELDVANSITRLTQGSDAQVNWKKLITSTISADYPLNGYTVRYAESTEQDRAFYGGNGIWYERVTPSANLPIKWTVTAYDRSSIYLERTGYKLVVDVANSRTWLQRPGASEPVGWKWLQADTIAAKVPANGWTVNYTEGPERVFKGVTTSGVWSECIGSNCNPNYREVKREENVIYLNRTDGAYQIEIDISTGWYRLGAKVTPTNWKKFTIARFVAE